MATDPMNKVICYLRSSLLPEGADLADGQLLERFVDRRDAAALEVLVRRHGPMVWGVCRRILQNHHDAEDAFQATFLVLARKAASVRPRAKVGSWLYGVAYQTALKARATRAKRKTRERQVENMPEPAVAESVAWRDLQAELDHELSRLPEKYRAVIVLCDLEGRTAKEVAQQLDLPQGTVASRLARGRAMLAKRLVRPGAAVTGCSLAGVLSLEAASATVPNTVMTSTIKILAAAAAGQVATTGLVSAKVVDLSEGVVRGMLLTKLKFAIVIVLGLTITVGGVWAGRLRLHQMAQGAQDEEAATDEKALNRQGDKDPAADKQAVPGGAIEKPQASEDEKQKALADFSMRYALKPGEVLKRVATPFPPSRFVYHRQHYPKDDKAQDMMFLRWDNGLHFCGTIGGMKSAPRKVQLLFLFRYFPSMIGAFDVLPNGRRELEVRGDHDLLLKAVEGDFIARSDVPFEKIVARLEEILRDECKLPVRLTLQKDREAYTLFVDRQNATFGRDSKVPNPPTEEHISLTITKAYWRDSTDAPQVIRERSRRPRVGEGHLYVHVKERLASQDTVQYLKFLKQADRRFLFRAKDRPEIKGEVQFSIWSDSASDLREILLVIPKEEYAKMAPGVEYSINPANSTAGYQWKITGGLTIRRGPSSDNTVDALHKSALQTKLAEEKRRLQEQESKGVIIGRIAERDYGMPPMLLIASGIDAHGNLLLSGTEQRKKQLPREIEIQGKKTTLEVTVSFPVTVLDRQTVSLSDATICDLQGNKLSVEQARERLREPTPVLLTCVGEKIDPIYLKIMTKGTLTFAFPRFPDFKELGNRSASRPASHELKRQGIAVGARVPDFSVQTLDGKTVKLSEMQKDEKRTKKGVVVLTFWCSTCGSCRRVEHDLDKLAKDYAGQAAIIALDSNSGEKAERVVAFAKEKGLAMPIVLDPSGRAADLFGAKVTTTTVVIDGNGVLRYYGRFKDGHVAYAEQALKAVLAGKEVEVKETPPDG
jgi:RNA polymerase sigma factor (sigma-70 family)